LRGYLFHGRTSKGFESPTFLSCKTIWRNPFGLPPDCTGGLAVRSPFRDFAHQKVLQNAKHFAKPPVRCNQLKQVPSMKTKFSIMFLFLSAICFGQTLPKINSLIEKELKSDEIPAIAVAVIENGKVVHLSANGFSDLEKKDNATINTSFQIASVSKIVT